MISPPSIKPRQTGCGTRFYELGESATQAGDLEAADAAYKSSIAMMRDLGVDVEEAEHTPTLRRADDREEI